MTRALLLLALAGGCAQAEVDLTIGFDPTVDDALLGRITTLEVAAAGAESYRRAVDFTPRARALRQGRLVYRAGVARGELDFTVSARAGGSVVAEGVVQNVAVREDRATPASVTLTRHKEPSLCGGATVLLCDDFENVTTVSTAKWNTNTSAGSTVEIDATRAYRGQQSLHVHVEPMGTDLVTAFIEEEVAVRHDPLFVRAFVFVPSAYPMAIGTGLIEARQTADPYGYAELGFLTGRELEQAAAAETQSTTVLPADRWVCLEWGLSNGAQLDLRVWLDGVEVTDLRNTGAAASPPFGLLRLGASVAPLAGAPPFDLWLDEVAVDVARLGCPQ